MMQTTTQNVALVPGHDGSTYPNYSKKSSMVLGIFHLVLVCVMFIASVVGVALATKNIVRTSLMIPMIACALYIAAGICAVVAGCNAKRGVVIASTVLNIICAVIAFIYVILMVNALFLVHARIEQYNNNYSYSHPTYTRHRTASENAGGVIFLVYIFQAVVTIWISAIGCIATCGGSSNQNDPSIEITTTRIAPYVVAMHGQQMQQPSYVYDQQAGGYNPGSAAAMPGDM